MSDGRYAPTNVPAEHRAVFEQLSAEFGPPFQIWRRSKNLGRQISAAVLDPTTNVAVIVPLRTHDRIQEGLLDARVIDQVREHLRPAKRTI